MGKSRLGMESKKMKKKLYLLYYIIALFMCFPVIFLMAGSFMGEAELKRYSACIGKGKDFVTWGLLPKYPTLRSYVQLLLDTPQFFVMFWNSVK